MFAKFYRVSSSVLKLTAALFLISIFSVSTFSACGSSSEANSVEKEKITSRTYENEKEEKQKSYDKIKIIINNDESDESDDEEQYFVIKHNFDDKDMESFRIDMSNLKEDLDELRKDLQNIKINIDLDMDELSDHLNRIKIDVDIDTAMLSSLRNMDKNFVKIKIRDRDSLASLIDEEELEEIRIKFNSETFQEEMVSLEKDLEEMRKELAENNIDIEIMSEGIAREARELSEEILQDMDFEFEVDKEQLAEEVNRAKKELESLDIDLKKVNEFTDKLTRELIKDEYIPDDEKRYSIKFDDENVYLDGKELSDKSAEKYRNLFKKYFDRYPDEEEILKR